MRRFQCEDQSWEGPLPKLVTRYLATEAMNQTMVPIDIHLSHASRCAEQLIEIIRSYNPDTFPLMARSEVRGIVVH